MDVDYTDMQSSSSGTNVGTGVGGGYYSNDMTSTMSHYDPCHSHHHHHQQQHLGQQPQQSQMQQYSHHHQQQQLQHSSHLQAQHHQQQYHQHQQNVMNINPNLVTATRTRSGGSVVGGRPTNMSQMQQQQQQHVQLRQVPPMTISMAGVKRLQQQQQQQTGSLSQFANEESESETDEEDEEMTDEETSEEELSQENDDDDDEISDGVEEEDEEEEVQLVKEVPKRTAAISGNNTANIAGLKQSMPQQQQQHSQPSTSSQHQNMPVASTSAYVPEGVDENTEFNCDVLGDNINENLLNELSEFLNENNLGGPSGGNNGDNKTQELAAALAESHAMAMEIVNNVGGGGGGGNNGGVGDNVAANNLHNISMEAGPSSRRADKCDFDLDQIPELREVFHSLINRYDERTINFKLLKQVFSESAQSAFNNLVHREKRCRTFEKQMYSLKDVVYSMNHLVEILENIKRVSRDYINQLYVLIAASLKSDPRHIESMYPDILNIDYELREWERKYTVVSGTTGVGEVLGSLPMALTPLMDQLVEAHKKYQACQQQSTSGLAAATQIAQFFPSLFDALTSGPSVPDSPSPVPEPQPEQQCNLEDLMNMKKMIDESTVLSSEQRSKAYMSLLKLGALRQNNDNTNDPSVAGPSSRHNEPSTSSGITAAGPSRDFLRMAREMCNDTQNESLDDEHVLPNTSGANSGEDSSSDDSTLPQSPQTRSMAAAMAAAAFLVSSQQKQQAESSLFYEQQQDADAPSTSNASNEHENQQQLQRSNKSQRYEQRQQKSTKPSNQEEDKAEGGNKNEMAVARPSRQTKSSTSHEQESEIVNNMEATNMSQPQQNNARRGGRRRSRGNVNQQQHVVTHQPQQKNLTETNFSDTSSPDFSTSPSTNAISSSSTAGGSASTSETTLATAVASNDKPASTGKRISKPKSDVTKPTITSTSPNGIKPSFRCDFEDCNYVTNMRQRLAMHKRMHSGELLFSCDFVDCGYQSNYKGNIKIHKKHRHRIEFGPEQSTYIVNDVNSVSPPMTRSTSALVAAASATVDKTDALENVETNEDVALGSNADAETDQSSLIANPHNTRKRNVNVTTTSTRSTRGRKRKAASLKQDDQQDMETMDKYPKNEQTTEGDEAQINEPSTSRMVTRNALSRRTTGTKRGNNKDTSNRIQTRGSGDPQSTAEPSPSTSSATNNSTASGDDQFPFQCPEGSCNYRTKWKQCLTAHQYLHSGMKPFTCDYPGCNYRTNFKGNVNVHKRVHRSNELRCNFEGCNFTTSWKNSMTMHQRVHQEGPSTPDESNRASTLSDSPPIEHLQQQQQQQQQPHLDYNQIPSTSSSLGRASSSSSSSSNMNLNMAGPNSVGSCGSNMMKMAELSPPIEIHHQQHPSQQQSMTMSPGLASMASPMPTMGSMGSPMHGAAMTAGVIGHSTPSQQTLSQNNSPLMAPHSVGSASSAHQHTPPQVHTQTHNSFYMPYESMSPNMMPTNVGGGQLDTLGHMGMADMSSVLHHHHHQQQQQQQQQSSLHQVSNTIGGSMNEQCHLDPSVYHYSNASQGHNNLDDEDDDVELANMDGNGTQLHRSMVPGGNLAMQQIDGTVQLQQSQQCLPVTPLPSIGTFRNQNLGLPSLDRSMHDPELYPNFNGMNQDRSIYGNAVNINQMKQDEFLEFNSVM